MQFEYKCRKPINTVIKRSDMIVGNDNTIKNSRSKLTLDAIVN